MDSRIAFNKGPSSNICAVARNCTRKGSPRKRSTDTASRLARLKSNELHLIMSAQMHFMEIKSKAVKSSQSATKLVESESHDASKTYVPLWLQIQISQLVDSASAMSNSESRTDHTYNSAITLNKLKGFYSRYKKVVF